MSVNQDKEEKKKQQEMKDMQNKAKSYEGRWQRSMKAGNAGETYSAEADFSKNLEEQEKLLKTMNPNSKEYAEAERKIDEQKNTRWNMQVEQRTAYGDQKLKTEIAEKQAQNQDLYKKMESAAQKGNVEAYEANRSQYEKNVHMQEQMGNALKSGHSSYNDTTAQQYRDKLNLDIDMRDKLAEKVQNSKNPSEKDLANLEKYKQAVKDDEIATVKKQNQEKIESMRNRGEDKEVIKTHEEQNERSEQWVRDINK